MKLLTGKTILVTGASSGIGQSVCGEIHEQDGTVIGLARNEARLKSSFQAFGKERNSVHSFDLLRFEDYPEFAKTLAPLDGLVHSAGTPSRLMPVRNIRKADLDQTFQIFLYAPILLTIELLKAKKLKDGASVIFLSSRAAVAPEKAQMDYALAKSSLLIAARCMTQELTARYKIRFNAILPGVIDAPALAGLEHTIGPERLEEMIREYPLGIGQPGDVANLVSFLLSDQSKWISGSSFLIDGGKPHN